MIILVQVLKWEPRQIFEHNLQAEEVQDYRFQTIRDSYNSKSSESLEAQMEENDDEDVALAWLGNLNW